MSAVIGQIGPIGDPGLLGLRVNLQVEAAQEFSFLEGLEHRDRPDLAPGLEEELVVSAHDGEQSGNGFRDLGVRLEPAVGEQDHGAQVFNLGV